MITLGAILILAGLYWLARYNYHKYLTLRYKHLLYDVRDQLRELAIRDKKLVKDPVFQCLDTSISKTISALPGLNFFSSYFFYRINHRKQRYNEAVKFLEKSLNENEDLKQIYNRYGMLCFQYIWDKHFIVKLILNQGLKSILYSLFALIKFRNMLVGFEGKLKNSAVSVRSYPETSSIYQYTC